MIHHDHLNMSLTDLFATYNFRLERNRICLTSYRPQIPSKRRQFVTIADISSGCDNCRGNDIWYVHRVLGRLDRLAKIHLRESYYKNYYHWTLELSYSVARPVVAFFKPVPASRSIQMFAEKSLKIFSFGMKTAFDPVSDLIKMWMEFLRL